jgi:hypothetical protein
MKLALPAFFAAAFLALPAPAWPADPAAAEPVRRRFVPAPPDAAKGNGASFSMLHHMPQDDPGVTMVMAHAGVGESFPVQEKKGPKLFEVLLAAGDDDLLKLEVRRPEGLTKHDLKRDDTVWFKVADEWFSIYYPSLTVSSKDRPTAQQVMLIVNRFGK